MTRRTRLNETFKEAIHLSKEDVIEVEGVVREALPNTVRETHLRKMQDHQAQRPRDGHLHQPQA